VPERTNLKGEPVERRRVFAALFATALLLLPIASRPALASGAKPSKDTFLPPALRDSFPSAVSYPYSTAQRCADSALTARIYSAFTERSGLKGEKWPDAVYEVWIAAPHPFIESLLPGALCVTVHTASPIWRDEGAGISRQFIYFRGRYWYPGDVNELASEVGLGYDSSVAFTRAKLAVVLAGFEDLSRTWRRWGTYSRQLSSDTAVPALTFLKATKIKSFEGMPSNDGLSIEMLIGGRRARVFVSMAMPIKSGRTYPSALWGGGLNQGLDMPRLPERPAYEAKPRLLSVPVATYPESLRKAGIEGQAVVEVLVDTSGTVADVRLLKGSGNSLLDTSAMDAARYAVFTPGIIQHVKAPRWASLPFRFVLQ
jgi:TonB family protein